MNATSEVLGAEILELELLGFGGTYYFLADLTATGVGSPAWAAARVREGAWNASGTGDAQFTTALPKDAALSSFGAAEGSMITGRVRDSDLIAFGGADGATTGGRLVVLSGLTSGTAAEHLAAMGAGSTAGDMLAAFSGQSSTPAIYHLEPYFNWFAQHFQVADLVARGETTSTLFSEALKDVVLSGNSTSATNLIACAFAEAELAAQGFGEFAIQRAEIQAAVINAVSEAITDLKAIGLVDYIDMAEGLIRYAEMRGMDRGAREPDMAPCVNPEMIRPTEQREMVAP
jgi:hypothetical protein